jgi:hypothetical protein|tara:strand:+ start:238 stop:912 length:675 start_codon:yes stop_codon:yes gene_type:complete
MKKILIATFCLFSIILTSCSNSEYKIRVPVDPSKATLLKPANNSECLEVDAVKFEWIKSDNTDSYSIEIINLLSNDTVTKASTTNLKEVTLTKGQPYSWKVISSNNITSKVAKSESWKFYLSGEALFNHAPFPAEIVAPSYESSVSKGAIELSWTSSDVDTNDTHTFDIYLDKTDASTVNTSGHSTTKKSVTLTDPGIYYWKIITKDNHGNSSDSGVFKFTVTD